MAEFATVGVYYDPWEAHLRKADLESEGITAVIEDENIIVANPLFAGAVQGIKLRVLEKDVEKAKAVLGREAEPPESGEETEREKNICPECGSERIEVQMWWRRFAFFSILAFMFPVGSSKRRLLCLDCGHMWKSW